MHGTERGRLLEKLLRELVRAELFAVEHVEPQVMRLGECAPVDALREVANHALVMRTRFTLALEGHGLVVARGGLTQTLSTLRPLVGEDEQRAYRGALLDFRHGMDVVRVMREVARLEELFALIRWCDDWLAARRTLVARVEAQLSWFVDRAPPRSREDDRR